VNIEKINLTVTVLVSRSVKKKSPPSKSSFR